MHYEIPVTNCKEEWFANNDTNFNVTRYAALSSIPWDYQLCPDYDSPEYNEQFLKLKTSKTEKWEINFMVLDCDNTTRICDETSPPFGKRDMPSGYRWLFQYYALRVNPVVKVDYEENNVNVIQN